MPPHTTALSAVPLFWAAQERKALEVMVDGILHLLNLSQPEWAQPGEIEAAAAAGLLGDVIESNSETEAESQLDVSTLNERGEEMVPGYSQGEEMESLEEEGD